MLTIGYPYRNREIVVLFLLKVPSFENRAETNMHCYMSYIVHD